MTNEKQTKPDYEKQAEKAVEDLEFGIRQLIGKAAEGGESTRVITRLTKLVSLLEGIRKDTSEAVDSGWRNIFGASNSVRVMPPTRRVRRKIKRKATRPAGYPKFGVEGNSLVKTSWSGSKKAEYQHKAPKLVVDRLIEALLKHGADGKIVSTDELFPLSNGNDQIPDYQSYLCLLWLKENGLVNHLGREGYQVNDPSSFKEKFEQCWDALSTS